MTSGYRRFGTRIAVAEIEITFTTRPGEDITLEIQPFAIDPPSNWRPGFQVRQLLSRDNADELYQLLVVKLMQVYQERRDQYQLDVQMTPWFRFVSFITQGDLESVVAMLREAVAWRDLAGPSLQ